MGNVAKLQKKIENAKSEYESWEAKYRAQCANYENTVNLYNTTFRVFTVKKGKLAGGERVWKQCLEGRVPDDFDEAEQKKLDEAIEYLKKCGDLADDLAKQKNGIKYCFDWKNTELANIEKLTKMLNSYVTSKAFAKGPNGDAKELKNIRKKMKDALVRLG